MTLDYCFIKHKDLIGIIIIIIEINDKKNIFIIVSIRKIFYL